MVDESVLERTRKVVAGLLEVPVEKVTDTAHFVKDLGMESVQSVELIAAFEEEFDIEIEQDEVASIFTLDKASEWMKEALRKQGA